MCDPNDFLADADFEEAESKELKAGKIRSATEAAVRKIRAGRPNRPILLSDMSSVEDQARHTRIFRL